ncbi:MAG: hypothetical protein JXQ73_24470 [Phycisphaerae bacterium]|nr:hypothetical protein [Phycisphaerae bacterium]
MRAMRLEFGFLVIAALVSCEPADLPVARALELENGFRRPADGVKPWVYWWWVKGNVDEATITRDLEGMKAKGIGGLLLFDARGYHEDHVPPPPAPMEFMSPEWRKMVKFSMQEAHRLGLEMSINLSSCAGALKGPWDVGDDAPKMLVWTSAEVQGPRKVTCSLQRSSGGGLWDIALLACRHAKGASGEAAGGGEISLSDGWKGVVGVAKPGTEPDEIVDITDKVDGQGRLTWDAPAGRWTLLRFAFRMMEGRENDVDVLSAKAVTAHFQRMGRALLDDAGPLAGKTLTHFYNVSWEGASPTWTLGFDQEFRTRRGYDIRPYLPALAGIMVRNPEITQRFREDYRLTLSDCFLHNFYGTLREQCHKAGIQWHSESGGPWSREAPLLIRADQLSFWSANDMPQGEFWHPGQTRTNCRRTATTAHVYGRPLAAVEAFTHMQAHWSVWPEILKQGADAGFCDGVNFFIWHTFSASPREFGKPGIEYFAGTHLNPNVTWWEQAGGFLTYLGRCQHLLRRGRFVADVCCYLSDRNYSRWSRGAKWSEKPSLVLPPGYSYDVVNTDVLLNRLSFKGGRLCLPGGMAYRLLVVDLEDEAIPPEALRKIVELAESGATVVLGKRRPTRAPGLGGYPKRDDELRRLVGELWGSEGQQPARRRCGKGHVIVGMDLGPVLAAEGIRADVVGLTDYIHRGDTQEDIYFIRGKGRVECTFRVVGRRPELWDPVTGRVVEAACYRATSDGRTVVPLDLPEYGSVFVVFRRPAEGSHVVSISAPEQGLEVEEVAQQTMQVRLWREGRYVLTDAGGRAHVVEASELPEPIALGGPWEVRFDPSWGGPEKVTFPRLVPWNEHSQAGIKYYSGTARYRQSFELDETAARGPVRLELGKVCNIARVRVNGHDLGVVWCAPWTKDLTGVVRSGANKLEIEVANIWVNRLIGDAGLSASERRTKTNVALFAKKAKRPAWQGFSAEDSLMPSGLIGPVRIEFGRRAEVRLE